MQSQSSMSMSINFPGDITRSSIVTPTATSSEMKRNAEAMFGAFDNELSELEEMCMAIEWMKRNEEEDRMRRNQQLLTEINEDDEYLKKLEEESESIKKDLDVVEGKLENMRKKKRPIYLKKKAEFEKSENKLGMLQYRWEKREKINQGIQSFLDKYGICLGRIQDYQDPKQHENSLPTILFSRIHPFETRTYVLYFSSLSLKFDNFRVERAQPDFAEFGQLKEQTNKSQDILELLRLARRYWLRKILK